MAATDGTAAWDSDWTAIKVRTTLAEQIYQAVRERISSGQLAPSALVKERQLERSMEVSRTPVREALGRLVSEGFLEPVPYRGFRVPATSMDDLVDLYPALQLLEVLALELAIPKIRKSDLDRLAETNAEFANAMNASDVVAAVNINERFHDELAALCGNRSLCRLLGDLRRRVRRLEMLEFGGLLLAATRGRNKPLRRDAWTIQHAEILDALRRGNSARACELLKENRSIILPPAATSQLEVFQQTSHSSSTRHRRGTA